MFVNTQQVKKEGNLISHSNEVSNLIGNLRAQRRAAALFTYQAATQEGGRAESKMVIAADSAEALLEKLKILVVNDLGMSKIVDENLYYHLMNDLEVAKSVLQKVKSPNASLEYKFSALKELETTIEINAVPQLLDQLEAKEAALLASRKETLKAVTRSIDRVILVSLLAALVFTFIAASMFNREYKERKKVMNETISYKAKLEMQVIELEKANSEITTFKNLEKFNSTGRMARTIAHEIRNPLTNINLASEQLKDLLPDDEEAEMLCNMVDRNSTRINELISSLLNATKFMEINNEDLHINKLMDETLELANDRLNLLNIKTVKNYDTNLCSIKGDGEKLKIAILNIIVNAIEAMPEDNAILKISTYEDIKGRCCVKIGDNGKGMTEEVMQKLFDPFFTSKEKGTGLGLTNSQNIIITHKGLLNVNSQPGEGSEFEIVL